MKYIYISGAVAEFLKVGRGSNLGLHAKKRGGGSWLGINVKKPTWWAKKRVGGCLVSPGSVLDTEAGKKSEKWVLVGRQSAISASI